MFKFRYRAIQPTASASTPAPVDGCGHNAITLMNATHVVNFTSPGYPHGYATRLNCSWTVTSAHPDYHPILHFIDMDVEDSTDCVGDFVKVSGSKDVFNWKELTRVCNLNFRGLPWSQHSLEGTPNLKVEFFSDYYGNRTGFSALTALRCGGVFTEPNGVINSMNVTQLMYAPNDRLCMYNITVRPGRQIKFEFERLGLEKRGDTCSSYIVIKNGMDDTAPLLDNTGQICGVDPPILSPTSSRYAFVKFINNNPYNMNHFRLKYREIRPDCGGSYTLNEDFQSMVISTPNYPNIPNAHSECVWTFLAPAGESISISFMNKFDLYSGPCNREYVELRDGGTGRSIELATYCGFKLPPPVTTKSNMLRVKYFTDEDDPKSGFQANVTIAKCGGYIRNSAGFLKSPGYGVAGGYPAAMTCDYRIIGSTDSTIKIKFLKIDLPQSSNCSDVDHVAVYTIVPDIEDRNNETLIHHGTYCGNAEIPEITGNSNEILIRFQSFSSGSDHIGFRLKFNSSINQCGGEITAEAGEIISPGYPIRLNQQRACEWRITVPRGRRVVANLVDFDIGGNSGIFNPNRLTFYNGLIAYNRIKTISSSDQTEIIKSSDNTMLISFFVRTPSMNRGFKILFSSDEATICEGSLENDSGTIYSPLNQTSYVCEYRRQAPIDGLNTGTLLMEFKDVRAGTRFITKCNWVSSRIMVKWVASPRQDESTMLSMCGPNVEDSVVRTPFLDTVVDARHSVYGGDVNFTMNYWVNRCGGVFRGSLVITNPTSKPSSTNVVGCAWYVSHDEGITFHIQVRSTVFSR